MCAFIAEHRARFGVAQICRVLTAHGAKISPRTFYAWAARPLSKRALWDTTITEIMAGYYEPDAEGRRPPESLYGAVKMWAHLQRQGIPVARCTVERLMRSNGWQGVTHRKRERTTVANPSDERAPDLVDRQFKVPAPNQLIVADFTYVPMAGGSHMYTAFRYRCIRWPDRGLGMLIDQDRHVRSHRDSPRCRDSADSKVSRSWATLFIIPMPVRSIRRCGVR
ncbi:hypothetical protein BH683_012595 [Williamsia sp. 1138]|nr:hypothetical protein BH683_012595 [Williamsia sp. 1138]